MANSISTQVVLDGPRTTLVKFEGVLDSANLAGEVVLDPALLVGPGGNILERPVEFRILNVWANVEDGLALDLSWQATASVRAASFAGRNCAKYDAFGGLSNNAGAGKTGKLLVSSRGWSGVKSFSLVLEVQKVGVGAAVAGGSPWILTQMGLPVAFAASPRRLSGSYSGPAMRVRRNSDNAEANIEFTPAGDLDESALLGFTGGSATNLTTYSEGTIAQIGVTGGGVITASSSIAGYSNSLQFMVGIDKYAYKTNFLAVSGDTYSLSVIVQMDDNSTPVFGAVGSQNDAQLKVAGVFAVSHSITGLGGGIFRVTATVISSGTNRDQTGVVKYQGHSTKGFRITAFQYNKGGYALPYTKTEASSVEAGSGFVTRMYDQSGFARDLTQSTAANQPRIVNAGVIERIATAANRPGYRTDGVSQSMATGSFVVAQPFTRSGVFQFLKVSSGHLCNSYANSPNTSLEFSSGTLRMYSAPNTLSIFSGVLVGDTACVTSTYNGSSSIGSYNGSISNGTLGSTGIDGITVGSAGNNSAFSAGVFSDTIIFPSALSTPSSLALEANQKTYYGTP